VKLDRAQQPKTYTSFYAPKERIAARERSNATIAVVVVTIAVIVLLRAVS